MINVRLDLYQKNSFIPEKNMNPFENGFDLRETTKNDHIGQLERKAGQIPNMTCL